MFKSLLISALFVLSSQVVAATASNIAESAEQVSPLLPGLAVPNVELKDGMRMALNWQSAMMDVELAVHLIPLQNKAEIKQGMLSISSPQTCH